MQQDGLLRQPLSFRHDGFRDPPFDDEAVSLSSSVRAHERAGVSRGSRKQGVHHRRRLNWRRQQNDARHAAMRDGYGDATIS